MNKEQKEHLTYLNKLGNEYFKLSDEISINNREIAKNETEHILNQVPFTRYHDEKKVDSFSVRFNEEERNQFEIAKKVIEQVKDSTALKQFAQIGMNNVLHDKKTALLLGVLFKNKRNNKRLGVPDFE